MHCEPHKAHGATTPAHRIVGWKGRDTPMCVACWKLAENGRDPFPPKENNPRINADSRGAEKQQSRDRSEAKEAVPRQEANRMPKTNPCDWQALFADARAGVSISELTRKYGPAWETIHKRLKAEGITPVKGVGGPKAAAPPNRAASVSERVPAQRRNPKAATAIVLARQAQTAPINGAAPEVTVKLRTAQLEFTGASDALKAQLAEIAKFFGGEKS